VGCATCRHPRESLAELLLAIAILALFVVVFVIPAVSR
jgi:Tfp pilus assembly protein FimT